MYMLVDFSRLFRYPLCTIPFTSIQRTMARIRLADRPRRPDTIDDKWKQYLILIQDMGKIFKRLIYDNPEINRF